MAIKQTITFKCTPDVLYRTLTNSDEFAKATGAPADISQDAGGAFSCFDGQISGRMIELVTNKRIVQAWRAGPWEDGVYSIVRFEVSGEGDATTATLEQSGFPEGSAEHLDDGWHKMYWNPIKAYVSQ